MNKSLILDRDGVINIDKKYVYKTKDLEFVDGIEDLIHEAKLKNYIVICITNQSGIARGFFSEEEFHIFMRELNKRLLNKIGFALDAYYYCPHHPNAKIEKYKKICDCRKPKIGMFKKILENFNIDLANSVFIGDKLSDIEAAETMSIGKKYFLSFSNNKINKNKIYNIKSLSQVKLL